MPVMGGVPVANGWLGGPLPSHHQHHGRITIVSGQWGELQLTCRFGRVPLDLREETKCWVWALR